MASGESKWRRGCRLSQVWRMMIRAMNGGWRTWLRLQKKKKRCRFCGSPSFPPPDKRATWAAWVTERSLKKSLEGGRPFATFHFGSGSDSCGVLSELYDDNIATATGMATNIYIYRDTENHLSPNRSTGGFRICSSVWRGRVKDRDSRLLHHAHTIHRDTVQL